MKRKNGEFRLAARADRFDLDSTLIKALLDCSGRQNESNFMRVAHNVRWVRGERTRNSWSGYLSLACSNCVSTRFTLNAETFDTSQQQKQQQRKLHRQRLNTISHRLN